jgi:hypothetical protein
MKLISLQQVSTRTIKDIIRGGGKVEQPREGDLVEGDENNIIWGL